MATDQSVILIVDDAHKDDANNLIASIFGDVVGSQNISQPLSASGSDPATYWCGGAWETLETANILLALHSGTLPATPDWSVWNLTPATALAAATAMTIGVATNIAPLVHLNAMLASMNLQRIVPPM